MAAATTIVGLTTIDQANSFRYGGPVGKRRIKVSATFVDATNGIAVGSAAAPLLAAAFGLAKIEACGNLLVYTTSDGTNVRIYPAVPNKLGTGVIVSNTEDATDASRGDPADVAIATTETGKIEVEGYQ